MIGLKKRLAAIRRDVRDKEGRCALWVDLRYAEPLGTKRVAVLVRMHDENRGLYVGRGTSVRAAVSDAEKRIRNVYGRVEELDRV